MDRTKWNEIQAIVLFAVALLILISFVTFDSSDVALFTSKVNEPIRNMAGLIGAYLGAFLFFVMGYSAYVIPLLVVTWAVARLYGVTPQKLYFKMFGTFFLILASSAMFSLITGGDNPSRFRLGGIVGLSFSDFLIKYLGKFGAIVVIAVLFLLSVLLATEFLLLPFLSGIFNNARKASSDLKEKMPIPAGKKKDSPRFVVKGMAESGAMAGAKKQIAKSLDMIKGIPGAISQKTKIKTKDGGLTQAVKAPSKDHPADGLRESEEAREGALQKQSPKGQPREKESTVTKSAAVPTDYKLPTLDLLDLPPALESRKIQEDFEAMANILEGTLKDFDIEAKVVEVNQGPVITRYELEPAPGVKLQRVTSLGDNIALAMKATSVRIIAPIPGKGTIGIEVPNSHSSLVFLREILA